MVQLRNSICDVPGIMVGHAQDEVARTGCTVILPRQPVIASVEVRGLAPGSRELDLLDPVRTISHVHAILLTGGSAFGLDSAQGVVQFLEEQNIGYDTGIAKVPLVPAAVIYDLGVGSAQVRPDRAMGYLAANQAHPNNDSRGLVGAGTGATVGKFAGHSFAMNGGLGTCSGMIDDRIIVGVMVVVNALGNIIDPISGQTIAGARDPDTHQFIDPALIITNPQSLSFARLSNTTLAVVATNAQLNKAEAKRLAQMATTGITRTTYPAHTPFDGDVVFALSTGELPRVDLFRIGLLASNLIADAIIQAVKVTNPLK
ncbi:MAG: P1 family peptidase [candidate division KSB1 bacterium]|nr:P1 family peptidase [candidate division KSB1 bacterium]MDZ7333808.1 P1 family peptidase [candidate division KSB1 bacterium]MDZ7356051.1 P1 family peptidase [candidate division KSB1 bacterium]MDZ7376440.1 P1 family peptidase [candidate division KSB1 bacterium]MDZ7400568.1 P1 family peptidase [candidate division KSB1 bacterium]